MHTHIRTALVTLVCVTGATCIAMAVSAEPSVGDTAPALSISDETGAVHDLASYAGKVVVLEWTNPDCPYVQRHYEADTMESLAEQYDGKEIVWLAVNSTHYNNAKATQDWKAEQGFSYATLQDEAGAVGRRYGARTTPHMFVIDPAGKLAYKGAIDDDPRGRAKQPKNYVNGALKAVRAGESPDPSQTSAYGCSVKYAKR